MYGYARTTLFSHAYIDLIFMAIDTLETAIFLIQAIEQWKIPM